MRKIVGMLTALFWLTIVVLIGFYMGWVKLPVLEKSLSEHESECLVAAIHADARWAGDGDLAVRRDIALTVMRHAKTFKRDVCDVFRSGLTLIPEKYTRWNLYYRTEKYIRNSLEATEASWKSDLQLVQQLQKSPTTGCATHYVRKPRKSNWLAQSEGARAEIRSKMQSVGRAQQDGKEVGEAEFFCPK